MKKTTKKYPTVPEAIAKACTEKEHFKLLAELTMLEAEIKILKEKKK